MGGQAVKGEAVKGGGAGLLGKGAGLPSPRGRELWGGGGGGGGGRELLG